MMPKPTDGMVEEARKGLDWRSEFGRGGTEVGIARARDIVNRRDLSDSTVRRMKSFFARHEVDKKAEGFRPGEEGYPSNGRIAWALWGGDAGQSFANKYADERSLDLGRPYPNEHSARLKDPDQYDDFRREVDAGGDGIDFIYGFKDDESELQAIRFDKSRYTIAQAKDWLDENDMEPILFEPASEERDMSLEESQVIEQLVEELAEDRFDDTEVQHRSMAIEASPIDEKRRTVQIAVSSEEAVMRSFGYEVLEHSPDAIDLSFLASGRAPLLLDHDPLKQIGVIESVSLDSSARRLRATVRFGKGALAQEAFSDVVDGIRANISVGYAINKMEKDKAQKDTYVAKRWRPMEASLVSIPADVTVGVGRSADIPQEPVITDIESKVNIMSEVDIVAIEAEARKSAHKNAAQIIELGGRHNQSEMAARAIKEGKTIEEFRGELLEKIGSDRALEKQDIGMTQKEVKRFSLIKAIRAMANPNDARAQREAAFEFEVARAAADAYGRTPQGIMLPVDVLRNWKRDLNSNDDAALFTDDFRGNDFIDVLRNASSVMQAGARMLTGLSGDVKIPKKTAASTAGWISTEGGAASESEMTVGTVSMVPRNLGAFTDLTRQLMLQSSLDVEALIRDDLAQALALAIDKAGLEGTGSSGQPTGILSTSGVNTVTAFAAAVPTFAEVVTLETALAEDNALMGNLAYILPASMYGGLKTKEKATGTAQFVVEPGNTINGYRAIVSNQATAGNLYFGNFSDLLIGMWAGLDILVDPYTSSTSGTVRIVALQTVDVAVRHAVSFAYGNDGV
jgi:HK97 family phage major capsid protein